MIALLFSIWLNANLDPCARVGMIDPSTITITEEREATVYTLGDKEIVVTEEYRFYETSSPFLSADHFHLSMIARNLPSNDDSYRLRLMESVERPTWCSLPPSRPRA